MVVLRNVEPVSKDEIAFFLIFFLKTIISLKIIVIIVIIKDGPGES
jgi:hypothetical protein